MTDPRKDFEATRDECLRRAKLARESGDIEMADAYMQAAQAETESLVYAADARPKNFTGKARGERGITADRKEFLARVASGIGTEKREAIAAQAVSMHAKEVRRLWKAQGKSAERKLLNFMKNNRL